MAQASKLLETFTAEAIFQALKQPAARRVVSLGAPWFLEIVAVEQQKIENRQARIEESIVPEIVDVNIGPAQRKRTGKSMREKLSGKKTG